MTEPRRKSLKMGGMKLMVLGAAQVGKSALTVRFLTRRFIGEYHSDEDRLYTSTVAVNNRKSSIDILDCCCGQDCNDFLPKESNVLWADACIVVYSICDHTSYINAWKIIQHLQEMTSARTVPILMLANKSDLPHHQRGTDSEEARALAEDCGCQFGEVSAAEGYEPVADAFHGLMREARGNQCKTIGRRRRLSFRTVSKAIAIVFGRRNKTL